mgnify:CR=1 FL=1
MKIGIPLVFSGRAPQVSCLAQVLTDVGLDIETTSKTTPDLWENALSLGSNETCLPVRIYIAHCHKLVNKKKVDVLLAPNIWREVEGSAACAKYRDVGGIALRALSSTLDYALGHFPFLLQPNLLTPKKEDLGPVLVSLINDLDRISEEKGTSLPRITKADLKKALARVPDFPVITEPTLENKPRLGLIARRYLLDDPLLSLNVEKFFTSKGFQVLTPYDLPDKYLTKDGLPYGSYYDSHIQSEQFLHWGKDKLDGIIILSSFACHPDAFLGPYLEEQAHKVGLLAWHFVCDSNVDLGGFITRFETIATLLQQPKPKSPEPSLVFLPATPSPKAQSFITWPYMGEPLNLSLKQLAYDLGLEDKCLVPEPPTSETMKKGSTDFAETCCPYALTSGSLEESVVSAYTKTKAPIDVNILMLHGEGPCAFGWYSIAMKDKLPAKLHKVSSDISINWITTGMDQPVNFWQDLAALCSQEKQKLLNNIKSPLSFLRPTNLPTVLAIARHAYTKLQLAEKIKGLYLLALPIGGKIAEELYSTCLTSLDQAKNISSMYRNYASAEVLFQSIISQRQIPRVIVVGEIYVAITPYANRYTVDKLLGENGVQVVEGVNVSHYLAFSVKPVLKKFLANLGLVKTLNRKGLKLFAQGLRDNDAAPYLNFEVGGDGVLSVGAAKRGLKNGAQGIVHIYPLNCMPEIIAKPALQELAALHKVPYLGLSFNRETDTERLITEVRTFTRLVGASL